MEERLRAIHHGGVLHGCAGCGGGRAERVVRGVRGVHEWAGVRTPGARRAFRTRCAGCAKSRAAPPSEARD
jgi:hypothetical protein